MLTAWALRRSGMERREVAARMTAFLVLSLALSVAIGIWLAYAIVRPLQRLIGLLGDPEYVRVV